MNDLRWQAVIAGVGGQGVLFATRVLAEAARTSTGDVLISEVHGMAQRGGSVVSHLKTGGFSSPLVTQGAADLLFALDAGEAVRNVHFLAEGGKMAVNAPGTDFLSPEAEAVLRDFRVKVICVNATALAFEAGAPRGANVVLLGAAAAGGALPFTVDEIARILENVSPASRRETNLTLFGLGGRK